MLKDYILLIDKPSFMTSQDCLIIIKKKLNLKKIGHTGTLDPLATGLMIVLVNEATKISDFILKSDKVYIAKMQLFLKTDTGDITGKIIESKPHTNIKKSEIIKALQFYNNRQYEQIVPAYSSIKINGKKLYEYANHNIPLELPKRKVYIKSLKFISFSNDLVTFEVECSKGTYIRSLVIDIARILHTSATLTYLRRINQSGFNLNDALNLDIINEQTVSKNLISIYDFIKNIMPVVIIKNTKKIINGSPILINNVHEKHVLIVNSNNLPLAIYRNKINNLYVNQRGFKFNENLKN